MAYSSKVIDHYENPRNIGTLDKNLLAGTKTFTIAIISNNELSNLPLLTFQLSFNGQSFLELISLVNFIIYPLILANIRLYKILIIDQNENNSDNILYNTFWKQVLIIF